MVFEGMQSEELFMTLSLFLIVSTNTFITWWKVTCSILRLVTLEAVVY